MKNKQYGIAGDLILKLAVLTALTLAFLCSGCEILKTTRENKTDTASVKKTILAVQDHNEGGQVRTEDNHSIEESEWFRVTMKYLAENKNSDTTINNFFPQPATVIYESGNTRRQEENKLVDSSWYQHMMKLIALSVDSMSRKVDNYEKTKHSETKGIGWITISLIGIGLIALNKIFDVKLTRRP